RGGASGLAGGAHGGGGDGAEGAAAFAEFEQLFGRGHVLVAGGDGATFADAEIVDRENVRAAKAEDEEHFDSPGAYAADGNQPLDQFFVRELARCFKRGNGAIDGFLCQVFHGKDFGGGE